MTGHRYEYRCTRSELYGPSTAGHREVAFREGYYVWSSSPSDAVITMSELFPGERDFTVDATGKARCDRCDRVVCETAEGMGDELLQSGEHLICRSCFAEDRSAL